MRTSISTIFGTLFALAIPAAAHAFSLGPPGVEPEESLEYRVANADVIVLGTIGSAAGHPTFLINIAVLEAFKGNCPAQVAAFTDGKGSPTPTGMQDLIFLRRDAVPGRDGSTEYVVRSVVRLDDASGVYGSDFVLLTDTDEIIAATRRAIAFGGPEEKKTAVLLFPPQTPGPKLKQTPGYLAVPLDARLEELGRRWASARDPQARVRAAAALSYFHSPENVEILKGLLTDSATPYSAGAGKWKRGMYAVREEAYKTLASWGVDVEMPELEGPMYQYRPAYMDWVLWAPIAIVGWVLLSLVVQRRRFRLGRTLVSGFTFVSVLAAAALVVLWVRSWFIVDELMFPAGTAHHQVASYRGGVQYLVMLDAEVDGAPMYGAFDLSNVEDQWGLTEHTPADRWERLGFGFAVGRMMGPHDASHAYRTVRVPYYLLLAGTLVLPGMAMLHWWRGWQRVSRGLCRACGYDMRASRGRCPECGEREAVLV